MLITLNHLKSSLQAVKTYINNVLPKKVSDLVDDSGHYTKPSGGIPASDLADGVVPVEDVQVNGTSILSNGVANVPIHTGKQKNAFGVVRTSDALGVSANNDGQLYIYKPSALEIKGGTHQYRPIVPTVQDASTFYGLAKAAGDTTQSASANAVGAYTDDAKIAIQKMLGIYEPPWELLNDITLSEIGGIDLTADDNGVPYDLLSVYMYLYYPANAETISGGYSRFRFYDTLTSNENQYRLHVETGRYQNASQQKFKHILVNRSNNMVSASWTVQATLGNSGGWQSKCFNFNGYGGGGFRFDVGTIKRISEPSEDTEPAGTRILIYGQRAY